MSMTLSQIGFIAKSEIDKAKQVIKEIRTSSEENGSHCRENVESSAPKLVDILETGAHHLHPKESNLI